MHGTLHMLFHTIAMRASGKRLLFIFSTAVHDSFLLPRRICERRACTSKVNAPLWRRGCGLARLQMCDAQCSGSELYCDSHPEFLLCYVHTCCVATIPRQTCWHCNVFADMTSANELASFLRNKLGNPRHMANMSHALGSPLEDCLAFLQNSAGGVEIVLRHDFVAMYCIAQY